MTSLRAAIAEKRSYVNGRFGPKSDTGTSEDCHWRPLRELRQAAQEYVAGRELRDEAPRTMALGDGCGHRCGKRRCRAANQGGKLRAFVEQYAFGRLDIAMGEEPGQIGWQSGAR